ncbi:hypothetical protein ACFV6Z_26060, partial [Streptomyces sp. NPDC059818]
PPPHHHPPARHTFTHRHRPGPGYPVAGARDASGVLADDGVDDGYGGGVRAAIGRLERRLREL